MLESAIPSVAKLKKLYLCACKREIETERVYLCVKDSEMEGDR